MCSETRPNAKPETLAASLITMRDIGQLLNEIIPPNDYSHRNGFTNERTLLSLSENEKEEVEASLIEMLERSDDTLIGESLMILKSVKSLPILEKRLNSTKDSSLKISWAGFINEIKNGDVRMKDIALKEFDRCCA